MARAKEQGFMIDDGRSNFVMYYDENGKRIGGLGYKMSNGDVQLSGGNRVSNGRMYFEAANFEKSNISGDEWRFEKNLGYIETNYFGNKGASALNEYSVAVNSSQSGGGWNNSSIALDVGGGLYGALQTAITPNGQWLGKNGKYYSNNWGGNQYTGSRSGAFKVANQYKWAGRGALVGSAIIGGVQVYNGYQMDGGQFGYNAQVATGSTVGSLAGGLAGAEIGAYIGGAFGALFGGVGAVPGAVIGGFVGGWIGGSVGGDLGATSVNKYYGK